MAVFFNPFLHPFALINRATDQSQPFITLVNWWFFLTSLEKNPSINYYFSTLCYTMVRALLCVKRSGNLEMMNTKQWTIHDNCSGSTFLSIPTLYVLKLSKPAPKSCFSRSKVCWFTGNGQNERRQKHFIKSARKKKPLRFLEKFQNDNTCTRV